jgi:hypothetical protein
LLLGAGLVGASPASQTTLRRSIWIYINWMKLNTIDDNKRKL